MKLEELLAKKPIRKWHVRAMTLYMLLLSRAYRLFARNNNDTR